MFLHNFWVIVCVLGSFQLLGVYAYPMLNIPLWYGGASDRYKKNDMGFPQVDADVIELEHLKEVNSDDDTTNARNDSSQLHQQQQEKYGDYSNNTANTGGNDFSIKHADLLPELERELELLTVVTPPSIDSVSLALMPSESEAGQPQQEEHGQGAHPPPMLPHNDGGKTSGSGQNQAEETAAVVGGTIPLAPAKPFYGAARLAFGQNPEVLPTSSTTSTSTTTTVPTLTINDKTNNSDDINEPNAKAMSEAVAFDLEVGKLPATSSSDHKSPTMVSSSGIEKSYPTPSDHNTDHVETKPIEAVVDQTKESIVTSTDELKTPPLTAARRSAALMSPKTAESLLKHRNGQYSSFDMAQYVFWTGDEAGVAHAVEEFIVQGLMTRENALKFLRDIHMGIEYLQKSYAYRVFPDEIRQNSVKKSIPIPTTASTTTTATTFTSSTTTDKPFPYVHLGRTVADQEINANQARYHESISMWNKLQELNNDSERDGRQDFSDYDESTGRAKIAEFLYTEYTLEEILYKLAKVMFTQSLAHGSNEAQLELQKLTDFLEREGNRGVIPIDLQKKILHVLLSALSDTLREHPGLLPAARLNLGNPYNQLPMHAYGTLK